MPPTRRFPRPRRGRLPLLHRKVQLWIAGLAALAACGGESTAPPDSPLPELARPLAVGDTVVADLPAADSLALFVIRADQSAEVALFVQPEAGDFGVTVSDSTLPDIVFAAAPFGEDPTPGHLAFQRTGTFQVTPDRPLLVKAQHWARTSPGRIRLWLYRVNRAPEAVPGTLTIGDTLQGEPLENSADVDEFTFDATAGDELIAFVQGVGGVVPGGVTMDIVDAADTRLAVATSGAADADLELQRTGRFIIPASGSFRLIVGEGPVHATEDFPGSGAFRVLVRRIDRRPEHAPVSLTPGDTLDWEAIDFVGDVDEFEVPVTPDSLYNVFLQALPSPDAPVLEARAVMGADTIALATSTAGDTALAGQFTGNVTGPSSGVMTLQVNGLQSVFGLHRGAYRLFVYPVNRAPETATAAITIGDSVTEAVDFPGDVDRFVVSAPPTGIANLVLRRGNSRPESLDLRWSTGGRADLLGCGPRPGESETACGTGKLTAPVPIQVEIASGLGQTTPFRGSYRLTTIPIDLRPEGRPSQIAVGDVISETIDPVGDEDDYLLDYTAGTILEIDGTGGDGSPAHSAGFTFRSPSGTDMPGYADGLPVSTGRFTLPQSGTYRLAIGGSSGGRQGDETLPYQIQLREFNSQAEVVTGPLGIGDSVTAEPITPVGDVDDFVVQAAPGTELQVFVGGTTRLTVDAVVAGGSTPIRTGAHFATGRVTVPAAGSIGIRVYEPRTYSGALRANGLGYAGPYALAVHEIDRTPEVLGSAVALGATTEGEAVDFAGDVDEFTFTGSAGQEVTAVISAPLAFDGGEVLLQIVRTADGSVLGSATSPDARVVSTGPIQLPGAGTYLVRIQGVDDTRGRGGYRFMIQ